MSSAARLCAVAITLAAAVTLVLHVHLGLDRHPGRTLGYELWRTGRYFTILTTALTALVFAVAAARGRMAAGWAGGVSLWTAIVGLVYHLLLARDLYGLRLIVDHMMHSVLPVVVVIWWLAFAPKAALGTRHALWWLLWPGFYCGYALIRGALDGRHPYFFLDPGRIGWPGVAVWVAGLGLAFWLGGLALVAAGRRIARTG